VKLVVDDKIPHVAAFFTACDDIIYLPGEAIQHADLINADLLLVRTVTHVDEKLLKNTTVKWVGTATTGTDHIDTQWLSKNHIAFADAAGANANAVLDYVLSCVAGLKKHDHLSKKNATAGIIGCGRIGRLVAKALKTQGFQVICYDPLLTEKLDFNFVELETLLRESDFITLHIPLTKTGLYPTYHMIDQLQLNLIQPNAILLNCARGAVINQQALLQNKNIILCLDVWENEPDISLTLLNKVTIGTPHIAGYSKQAKFRATQMMYDRAAQFFGWPPSNYTIPISDSASLYDPFAHTTQFRAAFAGQTDPESIKQIFIAERKRYPLR
jgi:erythronate-4-phosphate dehydrogenase